VCEVVKRQRDVDARRSVRVEDLVVVVENPFVDLPRSRLDLAPLDRQTMGLDSEVLHESDVVPKPVPVVTGTSGSLAIFDPRASSGVRGFLPGGPVAVRSTAFDLMGGRGDAELKAGWKTRMLEVEARPIPAQFREALSPENHGTPERGQDQEEEDEGDSHGSWLGAS
jgi:hypothetical protein